MAEWRDSDVGELNRSLREHILPELTQLRVELNDLREAVWPWVQAQKEKSPLDDIQAKRRVLSELHDEDARHLLETKARISNKGLVNHEYGLIFFPQNK